MPAALGIRQPQALSRAWRDFQDGPDIRRPNLLEQQIPVIGSAWQAAGDLQDGNYGGALLNGAIAVAEATPLAPLARGVKTAKAGVGVFKTGSVTADASRKAMRRRGVAKPGQEIHHTVPLNGVGRNTQNWRNHYALLKPLPKEQHRRLTGSFEGKPRYDPVRRVWYGTTDWQKAAPTGLLGYAVNSVENSQRTGTERPSQPRAAPPRPASATARPTQTRR